MLFSVSMSNAVLLGLSIQLVRNTPGMVMVAKECL